MARGPKKHMKRLYAPSHWMLDKLSGVWAPRPSTGPHKLRECLPLAILLRNRLKYALTYAEVKMIVMQRLVKVDGKVRTDMKFPAGLMDVVTIEKTKENFRLIWDTKGRFAIHSIAEEEAAYKLCRVNKVAIGKKGNPYCGTHDGRTIRFPDPEIKPHDTVRVDIASGKILDWLKFEVGNLVMATKGNNIGRIGTLMHRERHPGSFEIVHVKDSNGNAFATRLQNVMVIGEKSKPWISLPKGNGILVTNMQDRDSRLAKHAN
jgi:small subunit ribosomal protein S4e